MGNINKTENKTLLDDNGVQGYRNKNQKNNGFNFVHFPQWKAHYNYPIEEIVS